MPPPPPGGRAYIPPPPPTSATQPVFKPAFTHPEPLQKPVTQYHQSSRPERRNFVYVRNIPKHYNQPDRLMTFFKNEGQIKEIKVNP